MIFFISWSFHNKPIATVVQASLDSRPASATTARHIVQKIVNEIKILVKDCEKCLFLQPMLSATKLKSIFDFFIFIPPNQRQISDVLCI